MTLSGSSEGARSEPKGGWVKVSIDGIASDGAKEMWPTHPRFERADPDVYLKKLGAMWMNHTGKSKKGEHYILNRLPDGFILLSRARKTQPDIRDKFLYGHGSGTYFWSPNQFWPHFLYLMNNRASPCQCVLCKNRGDATLAEANEMAGRRGRKSGRGASATVGKTRGTGIGTRGGHAGRPKGRTYLAEDEEGTEDVFKELVYKLKSRLKMDEEVTEPESMDWRAERTQLRNHFTRVSMQYSFVPRVGELVLWCPEVNGEIKFNEDNDSFQVYCRKRKRFTGFPKWRAGTVAQVPEEPVSLRDIVEETGKESGINTSGFRIETFPDPNAPDKDLSLQYKYVPLCNIRPLNYWDVFLQNIPADRFHPSIEYALTIMSSFSMLDKYRFTGDWPDASIYCRGIYLGAELLVKGDAVRLLPRKVGISQNPGIDVTDILVIKTIRLRLYDCDADLSSPQLAEKISLRVSGKAYTKSPKRAYHEPDTSRAPRPLTDEEVIDAFEITGMRGYGSWYHLNPPGTETEISINQIIGRMYESECMEVVFGDKGLGIDLEGVQNGRRYGQETDERIPIEKEWFCGDNRMETLALETFNGHEVGAYDDARDIKMWTANMRIIDGTATPADLRHAKIPRKMGRPRSGLIGSKAAMPTYESVSKNSALVQSALEPPEPSAPASSKNESEAEESEESEEDEESESDGIAVEITRPMYARGGTEESEGGDYRPGNSQGTQPTKRLKKGGNAR